MFFFVFLFYFFVCVCFLKLKIYILIHIWLCGRVSDKNFFTRPVSGNKAISISPNLNKFNVIKIFTNNWLKTEWIMGQFKNSETSETSEILEVFFQLFFFWLFDIGLILKIEKSEVENAENESLRFRRFQVFDLPLFDLTFSSDRLSFFHALCFFLFSFLTLFEFVFLGYWTAIIQHPNKSMFKVARV